jgi:pyruvate kinase
VDELLAGALECSVAAGLLSEGDLVIMVGGVPVGHEGATNFLKVHVVGEQLIGHES